MWDPRDSNTTFVALSGAVKVVSLPAYGGYGTTRTLNANRLLISDPSLFLAEDLRLAWYGGNLQQPHLQRDLTKIITSLSNGGRVIMFGPSGGGFASLEQATRIPGATVIVSNPQTDITLFTREAVERYLSYGWGIPKLAANLPFTSRILDSYREPSGTQIVYIQNAGDSDHVERHWKPFLDALHVDTRIASLTPHLGNGHKGPDKESFIRIFEAACNYPDWDDLASHLSEIQITRNI